MGQSNLMPRTGLHGSKHVSVCTGDGRAPTAQSVSVQHFLQPQLVSLLAMDWRGLRCPTATAWMRSYGKEQTAIVQILCLPTELQACLGCLHGPCLIAIKLQ